MSHFFRFGEFQFYAEDKQVAHKITQHQVTQHQVTQQQVTHRLAKRHRIQTKVRTHTWYDVPKYVKRRETRCDDLLSESDLQAEHGQNLSDMTITVEPIEWLSFCLFLVTLFF
jgi:hypothetical protein